MGLQGCFMIFQERFRGFQGFLKELQGSWGHFTRFSGGFEGTFRGTLGDF